uniref:DNA endonuclease activator Ctp1 C-terminal domain-containing protein n=1 Tax=Leptocylindrus danicus TaxID=163516 RepID=A0A7S2KPV9_9STRA
MHHRKSVATAVLSARDITRDRDPRDNDNAVLVQAQGNKEDGSTRTLTSCLSNASTVVVENTTTTTASSSSLSSRASKKRRTHHNTHTTVEEQDDDGIVALVKQEDDSDENNNNNNDNNSTMSMIIPAAAVTAAPSSSVSSSNSRINRATKSLAALKARCNIDATEEDVEEEDTNNKECYKYEEVVRKKEDRRQLKGYDCPDCRAFLDAICKDKNGKEHGMFNRSEFVQECSRHRARHVPEDTPPGFWELSFADSVAARGHNDQE